MRTRDVFLAVALMAALFLAWPWASEALAGVLTALYTTVHSAPPSALTAAALDRPNAQYLLPVLAVILAGFGAPWRRRLLFAAVLVVGFLGFDLLIALAGVDAFVTADPAQATSPLLIVGTLFVFHTFDVVFGLVVLLVFARGGRTTAPKALGD